MSRRREVEHGIGVGFGALYDHGLEPRRYRQQIEREPRLGIVLWRYFVRQSIGLQDRIQNIAVHRTSERVILALLQLADQLGSPMPDGALRLSPLTHHTIAEYVGTSREIVSVQMNRLRRMGLLSYNRRFIDVYPLSLRDTLKQAGD